MYAILDIETTGGAYDEEGITEIAIYRFDGHQVVDTFVSLVNPEKEIQPFVVKLTGIDQGMLKNAPKFHEVAKRIVEITEGCVLVAHNAVFDARILATEFKRLGYDYLRKRLCTVELSKSLMPDLPSYKLGKLCRSLGIPVSNRHRAEGDAIATVHLFKLLLHKDTNKAIIQQAVQTENQRKLAPKLQRLLEETPRKVGLFYLHDHKGKIIYVGKGKNLRSTVNKLFLKSEKKALSIQEKVVDISYETTGNELMTDLRFVAILQTQKPVFNRKNRRIYPAVAFGHPNLILVDKGRKIGEKSCILIEDDQVIGSCYTDLAYQLNQLEVLKQLITPLKDNVQNRYLIKRYLGKKKTAKIIRF